MTEHAVRLDRLPEGLIVPRGYEGRFGYDVAGQRLWFQGFMSKATFDRLSGLSDDWDYRSALERLFLESVPERGPKAERGARPVLKRLFGIA